MPLKQIQPQDILKLLDALDIEGFSNNFLSLFRIEINSTPDFDKIREK